MSVTDNARAEAEKRWPRYDDDAAPYSRGAFIGFLRGTEWAAARAETTTATTEDDQTGTFEAILAAHREEYDSDCGMYFGCSCGWDNDDIGSNEGYVEHVAHLLATARTRPTREQIAQAIFDSPTGEDWYACQEAADAVLALLGGDDRG